MSEHLQADCSANRIARLTHFLADAVTPNKGEDTHGQIRHAEGVSGRRTYAVSREVPADDVELVRKLLGAIAPSTSNGQVPPSCLLNPTPEMAGTIIGSAFGAWCLSSGNCTVRTRGQTHDGPLLLRPGSPVPVSGRAGWRGARRRSG
jgi:hypothetical protein